MKEKKFLICSGGTGGHLYPALAIVEYIKHNYPLCKILFIGTERGLEKKLISKHGINYRTIKSYGLVPGSNVFGKILNAVRFFCFLVVGLLQSINIVLRFKPDIMLGMGSYICAPVLLAGVLTGKKIVLHEQNYIPGRLNSLFSKFARQIFISFRDTKKYLKVKKDKVIFTGNPLREQVRKFREIKPDFKRWGLEEGRFTIVAFGGSLGAEKINNTILNLYDYFKHNSEVQILLICGSRFYDQLIKRRKNAAGSEHKLILEIFPYIEDMHEIYRISDIIISRAGANTISEIVWANIPSILIPYPHAIANHQFYNAEFLTRKGKAILIEDSKLDEKNIFGIIKLLMENGRKRYREMKKVKIKDAGINSAKVIVSKLMEDRIEKR